MQAGEGEQRNVVNLQVHEVKLHRSDNAWKPMTTKKEKNDPETDEREDFFRKVRGILNKLTPQKFHKLVAQLLDLEINTEEKLSGLIDMTFEKAISEPNFIVAYVNLCKCLNKVKVPQKLNSKQSVMFRNLLLNRSQREFERDKPDALDLEKMQEEIDEAETEERKEELKTLKDSAEQAETKARRRFLGNIRFMGELFKVHMLTDDIMHRCLLKLLRSQDDEAFCILLKTVGKDLDVDRAKPKVDQYIGQLRKMVKSKKNSSRLRCMMLDVIDLRKNDWVPQHEYNNQREDGLTPVVPIRKKKKTPAIDPALMKITQGGRPSWGRDHRDQSRIVSRRCDEVEKKSKSLVDEYLSGHDLEEALRCIKELKSPQTTFMCVTFILVHVLERSEVARKMTSQLLYKAIEQRVISTSDYTEGLSAVLEFADDMAIDNPEIWKYLGELVGPMIEHGVWHMSDLEEACKVLLPHKKADVLVAQVLHNAAHRQQPLDWNIQLGPLGRPGSFGTWGQGSRGGSKQASKESDRSSAPGNKYSLLSGGSGTDSYDNSRSGFGWGTVYSGGRDQKVGHLSQGRDRGDRGKIVSRLSPDEKIFADLAAASASGSRTPVGSRNKSRESSRNCVPSSDTWSAVKRPAATSKPLSSDEVKKKSKSLVDEYLSIHDLKEALQCFKELKSPQTTFMCVTFILVHVLERSEMARKMTSQLLYKAIEQKVILTSDYTEGLSAVLEFADDIDIPQIWKYLGELVGPMIEHGVWHMSNLKEACKVLLPYKKAGLLVAQVLHNAAHRQGHIKVGEMWRAAKMKWSDFLGQENQHEFLKRHKLEYTLEDEVPKSPEAGNLPVDRIQKQLETLIIDREADNEVVFDWINANVAETRTREPSFIRALMTAVCTSAIAGQGSSCKVEAESIKKRCILLQRYLDHDAKLELQALYALQALIHKLEHPPEVLRVFFDALYDEDIISEDAFYQWESNKDPAELAGKGVAVSSVVQFFTWIREAEEDDPDAANK